MVINTMIPVLMNVAKKTDLMIKLTCSDLVEKPITLISLILMVLIIILVTVTRIVTMLVSTNPSLISY